jgi:hypothetical protein
MADTRACLRRFDAIWNTMASLTIPFPEGTRTIALRGNRITIGRLPDNTIQVRDRTVSAYHAELILEGDHYRLNDKGSTNGVVIDGQRVAEYHLREDCDVHLGGIACQFRAAEIKEPAPAEMDFVPTRSEMQTILQANGDLRTEVAALRSQVEAMTLARQSAPASGQTVSLEQHDQLAAELATLRSNLQERQTQIERLTSLLAIVSRERDTLQKNYEDASAALDKARSSEATEGPAKSTNGAAPVGQKPAQPSQPGRPSTVPLHGGPTSPKTPQPSSVGPAKPVPMPRAPGAPSAPVAPPSTAPAPVAAGMPRVAPVPKAPGSMGNGSPARRLPSGVQPVAKPLKAEPVGAATASMGPKGTQKMVE